jgi:phosphomannomutase/phosphoglucomutase
LSKSIFREYDIRGIFPIELSEQTVKKIGYFFALEVKNKIPNAKYVSVGYDARTHSEELEKWLISGINYAGLEVLSMGLVATPVNYFSNFAKFLTESDKNKENKTTSASIMITGSHNPSNYNGFKITIDKKPFFGEDIYSLGEKVLQSDLKIEDNTKSTFIDAKKQYIDYMIKNFSHLKLDDKKFVFDCANGAAGSVLREILDGINLNYKIMYETPDGTFPNHHPDPSDEKNLDDIKKELSTNQYTLGFAYDGDADRIAVLSPKYNFKGDVLAIFFSKFIENPTVIGEVKCSQIMYDTINSYGKAIMYKTGHSNLKVKINETNASFAAEVSGHIFFNDRYFGYDDAIYSTLRALELVSNGFDYDKEFEKLPQLYSTPEINIDTTEDKKFKIIDDLKEKLKNPSKDFPTIKDIITVDGVRVVFENGWGLIRASNTTPKLVTRFEANDKKTALNYQEKLLELIND